MRRTGQPLRAVGAAPRGDTRFRQSRVRTQSRRYSLHSSRRQADRRGVSPRWSIGTTQDTAPHRRPACRFRPAHSSPLAVRDNQRVANTAYPSSSVGRLKATPPQPWRKAPSFGWPHGAIAFERRWTVQVVLTTAVSRATFVTLTKAAKADHSASLRTKPFVGGLHEGASIGQSHVRNRVASAPFLNPNPAIARLLTGSSAHLRQRAIVPVGAILFSGLARAARRSGARPLSRRCCARNNCDPPPPQPPASTSKNRAFRRFVVRGGHYKHATW